MEPASPDRPPRSGTAVARWEHFAHQADIGVRGIGATLEQAFEQAALALIAVITDPQRVRPRTEVELACRAADREFLLVEWLNTVVFEIATRKMLFARFEVHIDGLDLKARAWGETIDPARHRPAVEVKGATLTALRVARDPDGTWRAECVVDV